MPFDVRFPDLPSKVAAPRDIRPYVIKQEEHLPAIALRFGLDADEVWKDARHDALRDTGRTPHMLCAGDVIYLPESSDTWRSTRLGETNSFTFAISKMRVSVRFAHKNFA